MRSLHLKGFLSIAFALLLMNHVSAQGFDTTKWRFSNPKPIGFYITDVQFADNNNAVAVGSDGIAFSRDGGSSWTYGAFTYINAAGVYQKGNFSDVHVVNSNVSYAVGPGGLMAKTTNGGQNWNFVTTPLFANSRNINTVWFLNKDTGYIAGQWNAPDSIPKLYFTRNGGTTWDSLVSPTGGKSRIGYVNNPNLAPQLIDITAKGKEIYRIQFANPNTAYISGGGTSLFLSFPSANASTCLPTGTTTVSSANNASLFWKLDNGTLKDYSISKERLGYTGITASTITCTTQYTSQIGPTSQTYKAMSIINDTTVVLVSFNNNYVLKIGTGTSQKTLNIASGLSEDGKYEILNWSGTSTPPLGAPPIGAGNLLASNPLFIAKTSNGTLLMPSASPSISPVNRLWTSTDTGRTWVEKRSLPLGKNFSDFGTQAITIAPNGKILVMGDRGVFADSTAGGGWNTNYSGVAYGAGHVDMDWPDCNNGMTVGAANITVTTDGGKTWIDKARTDLGPGVNINGLSYPAVNKAYIVVSSGVAYSSPDQGTTFDPILSNFSYSFNDVWAPAKDTVFILGYNQTTVPAASRKNTIFRSYDAGTTWSSFDIVSSSSTYTAPTLRQLVFPTKLVGYAAGTRNAIWKTSDAGVTWTDISPFPSLNIIGSTMVTYTEIVALDANTVFAIGQMFSGSNIRRVYKTTDGGANWIDITGNLSSYGQTGNLVGLTFHDANNGYIGSGSILYRTTDGGTTWNIDMAPAGTIFETLCFSPRVVPSSYPLQNRKLFVTGVSVAATSILEYGSTANVNVNFTSSVVTASCSAPSGGSITVNASGGLPPYSYSINGGSFQSGNVFSGLTQGAKTITVKDAFCGISTASVTVGFNNNLTLTTIPATDTTVCAGAPVPLIAVASSGATYAWTPASGLSATNIANPTATNVSNATYTVTASLNACTKSQPVNIFIKPNPIVNAGPDQTILIGNQVTLLGSSTTAAQSIAWTPLVGLISGATTFNPIVAPIITTKYTMTVKDVNGCTAVDDANVVVIPMCLKVMEAFTPNADGQNDVWRVTTTDPCTTNIAVSVFNRYGNTVYKNNNYQNDWNGSYEGKLLPDGTYYYFIRYTLIDGKTVALKGSVTILR
jgi:gliding motility-associated-like protein